MEATELLTIEQAERQAIEHALAAKLGNKTHAAKALGISVRTLQRKLKGWSVRSRQTRQNAGAR